MVATTGYRQTEVGVIPEDWDYTDLLSVSRAPMQNGVFFEPLRKGKGIKLINVGDLYEVFPIDVESLELFDATDNETQRFKVEDGDLFFTRSSVVPSGIAQCNIFHSTDSQPVVFDSHIVRVRPDTQKTDAQYLFWFCGGSVARRYLVSHSKTATMTTIDQGVLAKCPILLPPTKAEQEAIAEALSDADALIESLEQLIDKKRLIKQGAMQELLTGKRRLPGFELRTGFKPTQFGEIPEDWSFRPLGTEIQEMTDFVAAGSFESLRNNIQVYDTPNYAVYVRLFDLRLGLHHNKQKYVDVASYQFLSRSNLHGNEILVANIGANVGEAFLMPCGVGPATIAPNMIVLRPDDRKVRSGYLFFYIMSDFGQARMSELIAGSGHPKINKTDLKKLMVVIPSLDEQEAIAALLSDMDSENAALETKLHKARQVKQGMMRNLLTGRIRLV